MSKKLGIKKFYFFVYIVLLSFISCTPQFSRYLPENPPPKDINFPEKVEMSLISPPPIYIAQNEFITKTEKNEYQYFKIAIPPCIDMAGVGNIKNSLADMFLTAIFDTKRFSMLDRMELKKIEEIKLKFDTIQQKTKDQVINQIIRDKEKNESMTNSIIDALQMLADGIMLIFITSDKKNINGTEGILGIDFRIVRSPYSVDSVANTPKDPVVLYASSKNISYFIDKATGLTTPNRSDINEVAKEIKEKFPNPDIQDDLKITNKRGNMITVNAGKNENILTGMVGYVVKVDKDATGKNSFISYRAVFEVKEVFPGSFNALLLERHPEDKIIIPTIQIGEYIKMK